MKAPTLNAKTKESDSYVGVCPVVDTDGQPGVAIVIRKDANLLFPSTLNGHEAFGVVLTEDYAGNTPWELAHQLVENWEEAKKMAAEGKRSTPTKA